MVNLESSPQPSSEIPNGEVEQLLQSAIEQNGIPSVAKDMESAESVKEKLSDYLKRKNLKIHEYFGQLNQEDFDQLLDLDFQGQLKDVPSIEGVFSPEDELAKIKSLPKEQKREALTTFKENLTRQRKVLANCRVFIERTIEFDHDVPRGKLDALVSKFGEHYGFNEKQRQIIEKLIDGYYENRQKVLEVRQQFTDDHELVKRLSGVNFGKDEKINVSVGPMSIDIDTDGFNAGRLFEKADKPVVGFKYGGFASQSIDKNPIYYTVINRDITMWNKHDDSSGKNRRNHEHEHQKNKLFRAVFEFKDAPMTLWGYVSDQDPEIKKIILEDFFIASRRVALEKVKNEITASLYDRDLPTLQDQLKEFFFSGEGVYDYLDYLRNWKVFKDDHFYQKTASIMLVQEYREVIQKAVDSYAELVKRGGYSIQEATALLTDKPLEEWPKTIKRLLEQK